MQRSIRVLLADRYQIVRHGVRLILQQDSNLRVVGEVASAEEAVEVTPRLDPDIVVIDTDHPDTVRRIKHRSPRVRVLVLTQQSNPTFVNETIAAGADAILLKEGSSTDLIRALQTLGRGECASPLIDPKLHWKPRRTLGVVDALSEREREILSLVAAGHTSKAIARKLQLSPRTVGNHRARIIAKLQVDNCVQATAQALQLGVIVIPAA